MFPEDFWEAVLRPYARDPSTAFVMAQIFVRLKETLSKGPAGALEVMGALDMGIKEIWQHTDMHEACYTLYQRSVSGGLPPHLDPCLIVKSLDKPRPRNPKRTAKKR